MRDGEAGTGDAATDIRNIACNKKDVAVQRLYEMCYCNLGACYRNLHACYRNLGVCYRNLSVCYCNLGT